MATTTYSARAVAKMVASRSGMTCDAKRVRAWARTHLTRFDDDAYTTHAYSASERDRIVASMVVARKATATGPAARASSAAHGRPGTAKTARKRAKVTTAQASTPPVAPIAENTDGAA